MSPGALPRLSRPRPLLTARTAGQARRIYMPRMTHGHASRHGRKSRAGLSPRCPNRNPRHAEARTLTPAPACGSRVPATTRRHTGNPRGLGKPDPRPQAPTPARADGTPDFLGGKPIAERKAPSAPEHRNWRGSSSGPSLRRQQPSTDHPQPPLISTRTSATDQPGLPQRPGDLHSDPRWRLASRFRPSVPRARPA
jgi:hypothetical protein